MRNQSISSHCYSGNFEFETLHVHELIEPIHADSKFTPFMHSWCTHHQNPLILLVTPHPFISQLFDDSWTLSQTNGFVRQASKMRILDVLWSMRTRLSTFWTRVNVLYPCPFLRRVFIMHKIIYGHISELCDWYISHIMPEVNFKSTKLNMY